MSGHMMLIPVKLVSSLTSVGPVNLRLIIRCCIRAKMHARKIERHHVVDTQQEPLDVRPDEPV